MGPINKDRLYITLSVTGQPASATERVFHWSLTTGPKNETSSSRGRQIHARNMLVSQESGQPGQVWTYLDDEINVTASMGLLARIRIAKILDLQKVRAITAAAPVVQNNPDWRCRQWIIGAVEALAASTGAVATSVDLSDWHALEDMAKRYANGKVNSGRFKTGGAGDIKSIPTFDMMTGQEVTP